jgi:hypothetical protein
METAPQINALFEVFSSILAKGWHRADINLHTSSERASRVVRSSALLSLALEASTTLGATEVALEIKACFVNTSNTDNLLNTILAINPGLRSVECAAAMRFLAIVGGE